MYKFKKVFLVKSLFFFLIVFFVPFWQYPVTGFAAGRSCSKELIIHAKSASEAVSHLKGCEPDPFLYHALGLKFIKENNNLEALPWIKKAAELAPDNPDCVEDYIVLLIWLGNYEEALNLFRKMPANFPRRPYLLRNVAMAALKTDRFNVAYRLYRETLEKDSKDKEAFEGLFQALLSLKRFEEAHKLLHVYGDGHGMHPPDLFFLRLKLYLAEDRPLSAYGVLKEASDKLCPDCFHKWMSYLEKLSVDKAQELSKELRKLKAPPYDVFLPLAATRQYDMAIDSINAQQPGFWRNWPINYLSSLAWVLFKNGNADEALDLYQFVLAERPEDKDAQIGAVYCFCERKRFDRAENYLHLLTKRYPGDLEVLFARAYCYEHRNRFFKAIETYDEILRRYPNNKWAKDGQIRAFSQLGLPSFAFGLATAQGSSSDILLDLKLDEAALFQHWGLAKEADVIYQEVLSRHSENRRANLDYLLNLRQQNIFPEVMKRCEKLILEGIGSELPFWAKSPCADAYLYYDNPAAAMKIYDEILDEQPGNFDAALGRLYCLTALRQWPEAEELGEKLFDSQPSGRMIGKKFYPNWRKVAVAIARGYILAETQPLKEAENYFLDLKSRAPAHSGIGAALGDVYLWRGWPRMALQELKIAANKDSKDKDARVSLAYALNDLGNEKEARECNSRLLKKFPYNKHIVNQKRFFDVQDMKEFILDFSNGNEDADSTNFDLRTEVNEKPFYGWRTYQYYLWQYSSFGKRSASFQRVGAGFRHKFSRSLNWQQEVSIGIEGDEKPGIGTSVSWTPDDYWNLRVYYNSYSTQTPLRARAEGIDSDELSLGASYNFSEWQTVKVNVNLMTFSDNNDRLAASLSFRKGIWKMRNWLSEMTIDNYTSFNSKNPKKVSYWNPRADWSCSVTHKLQYTQWRSFYQAAVHRLYLTGGSYYQRNYSTKFIGSMNYEFDGQVSLRTRVLFRTGLAHRVYDGDTTTALDFAIHFSYRF